MNEEKKEEKNRSGERCHQEHQEHKEGGAITVTVAGTPKARPRPRHGAMFSKRLNRAISVTYQPTKIRYDKRTGKPTGESLAWARAEAWYQEVRFAVARVMPADAPWKGPVEVTVDVYFDRTKELGNRKYPDGAVRMICKPDRDNLDKSILDSLTEAGLWLDDSQVCDGPVRKWWAARGCGPGVVITARKLGWTRDDAAVPLPQIAALDGAWQKDRKKAPAERSS